jgi:hypothetical protein
MNLFERLLHRRLCNEQPADGGRCTGTVCASSTCCRSSAACSEPAKPEGDKPQPALKVTSLRKISPLMVISQLKSR